MQPVNQNDASGGPSPPSRCAMRYALYFTPAPGSAWRVAGDRWLGRDAITNRLWEQPDVPGLNAAQFSALTADARRYGFHATLKAPFRLAADFTEAHLLRMATAFCAAQKPVVLAQLQVAWHRDFLALHAYDAEHEIAMLGMRCVSYFDPLRAPPSDDELAKRRRAGLSPRQEALLQRWGYPHTEELFRFHMTLTASLKDCSSAIVEAVHTAANHHFAEPIAREPLMIDGLTILREEYPGAPFVEWKRFDFDAKNAQASLPVPGRLV